jgi:oxygen-independent coproporphyrinogen-3 oxidase
MISLYFHVPFCKKKCDYCDFYSICDEFEVRNYIEELKKEITLRKTAKKVDTVFFGGGTPSILSENRFREIASFIKQNFNLSPNCEWTIECNPESFSEKKAKTWLELGVTRLSLGVQSLNDKELEICGRIHSAKQAIAVLENKISEEFLSLNVDLIYGLPQQSENSFMQTLEKILKIPVVKHISLYELTIAENSHFAINRDNYNFPSEEEIERIVESSRSFLKTNGFERYEVSNFAKKNHRCRHNENCWAGKKYLGFGPSAHSFDGEKRFANFPFEFCENLSSEQKKTEFLMLRLRTADGFSLSEFRQKFKIDFLSQNKKYIENLISNGYVLIENENCKLTDKGLDIADGIVANL